MQFSIVKPFILFLTFGLFLTACEKKEEITGFGEVVLFMDNRAGQEELVLGTPYTNANGDTLQFSLFNYFVSNFVLVKEDGSEFVIPKDSCYFLCKQENASSRKLVLKNVPAGNYSRVEFNIGVDSLKSVAPAGERTGVLDPTGGAAGMYWSWNAGYIFVKVEGTSPQAPVNAGTGARTFQYHTGLFGGKDSPTLNNLKRVSISTTTESARVREGVEAPEFHLYVDILEQFTNPTNINVATNPTSHAGPYSATVAANYADMFRLDHVHNHD
jgi:hypothetical protein